MVPRFCPTCGASVDVTASFCRRCGRQLGDAVPSVDAAEATTRTLEDRPYPNAPTSAVRTEPTGAAYLSPGQYPPVPQAGDTQAIDPRKKYSNLFVTCAICVAFLITLVASAGLISHRLFPPRSVPSTPTASSASETGADSGGESSTSSGQSIPGLAELVYPGAQ
ncbi:MAG TPA: zinc ribbon domain-containing protein, partial [Blastocatellia bacterium]|nr:zinc ribbon domain-containing protein [Blastocatellia bacterium]